MNKKIITKSVSIQLEGEFLGREYLVDKKRVVNKEIKYKEEDQIVKLDEEDEQICKILAENGREPIINLSSKIKKSSDAVVQRIKKLKKLNIISGSFIILNQEEINQLHYKVFFYLNKLDEKTISYFVSSIKSNNRAISIIKSFSEWDYEIDYEVESPNQLRAIIMNLTKEHLEIIKNYEIIRIINMPKYNFFP